MIHELSTNSQHLYASMRGSKVFISPGSAGSGIVRYNSNMGRLEVNDGAVWIALGNEYTVNLTDDATKAIEWATNKIKEEEDLKRLSKDHPAVQIAIDNLERAKQQLAVTINLSKEHAT